MQVIRTDQLDLKSLSVLEILQIYNGFDCCITHEVHQALVSLFQPETQNIYDHERALQAPALEMMLRGIRVDMIGRDMLVSELKAQRNRGHHVLDKLAYAVWGKPLNPNSYPQVRALFYDTMGIPKIYNYTKGRKTLTSDRAALERIQCYFHAKPLAKTIMAIHDLNNRIAVLQTGVDSDKRMRTGWNVGGTETGRWSSSKNAFGTGDNLQNMTKELRFIFVADPGYKMAYIDLEQAESRVVGLLCFAASGDSSYLDACESSDLHTAVARMVWPELEWVDDSAENQRVANQPFYRHFSYRDMAKRGGHATNYYGKPWTLSRNLKIEKVVAELFQAKYFKAFSCIKRWHQAIARELQTTGKLVTPLGRRRQFFDRLRDDTTLKEAIAYVPQSTVADILNYGLWKIWERFPEVHLLANAHDAVLVQYPAERETELIPKLRKEIETPITLAGRTIVIPTEVATGWNWSEQNEKNPDGLKVWCGHDDRRRKVDPEVPLLHRRIY